jgi:hypothetical protein
MIIVLVADRQRWQIVGLGVSEYENLEQPRQQFAGRIGIVSVSRRYCYAVPVCYCKTCTHLAMFSPLIHIEITGRTMSDFTVGFLGAGMMASAVMVSASVRCSTLVIW